MKIKDLARIKTDKTETTTLTAENYISTDNMMPNFAGISFAATIPSTRVTRFTPKDILISNIRPYFKKIWYATFNGGCSSDVICLNVNEQVCKPQYLFYVLNTDRFIDTFVASSKGTKMPRGDKQVLLSFEFATHSVEDQQHIVDILGSIDDKIENNEKEIDDIEQYILTKYDKFVSSCKNAKTTIMQEVFDISIGRTPPRKESQWFSIDKSDIPWLSISDMGQCNIYTNRTKEFLTQDAIKKFNIPKVQIDTVLLSFKLTIGKVAIASVPMATNEAIAQFVPKINNISKYLYFYLKRYNFDLLGNTSSIATAVNSKTIKSMPFLLPKRNDLELFSSTIEIWFEKIKRTLLENQKLNELKQLYLKKFFG